MARGCRGVPDTLTFSYSRNDGEAAINLRGQLQRRGAPVDLSDPAGPAQLAGFDVGEVKEAMVAEARNLAQVLRHLTFGKRRCF